MNADELLALLSRGHQLKRTMRTGWYQRGITDAENVAAHSYGVAYICLVMSGLVDEPLDIGKLLAMAVLHDLPEGMTSDIPSPAWRLLPSGTKRGVEREAMHSIVDDAPLSELWMRYWEELQDNQTFEARLVHDSDKLDMYLQAYLYEMETGNRQLSEFWEMPHHFFFPQAQKIYDQIASLREVE